MKNKNEKKKISPSEQSLLDGIEFVKSDRLFGSICSELVIQGKEQLGKGASAICCQNGDILLNRNEIHTPREWAWVIAHAALHRSFGHFEEKNMPGYLDEVNLKDGKPHWIVKCDRALWNMACDIYIAKFLQDIKFGAPLCEISDASLFASNERKIYDILINKGLSASGNIYGTARLDMNWNGAPKRTWYSHTTDYEKEFADAVAYKVRSVIDEAGNSRVGTEKFERTKETEAARWFIDHYPLLGGLASGFKIIHLRGGHDDRYRDISVAAIDVGKREIYVNTAANLSTEEWKFVLAHEYLHAGLQHHERCQGRDPYLWNVACDFVINGWLREMQIGVMPAGVLFDEELTNNSAEEIYDILIQNLRQSSKLDTLRGYGKGDILDRGFAEGKIMPVTLDDFCRSALRNGLEYHRQNGRGFIPSGLIEEIKALSMPPVPWDVRLAKWFDMYFAPLEKRRTYARPSRRQGSSPDIPRPRYVPFEIPADSRTFAVIIDTSGSMSPKLIGQALGAAASYSVAKEVPLVRVVFCDAAAYDIGYVSPEDIAGRVEVKGRGGTVLQPAVDLIENAKDFPKDGPVLIITDGEIEDHLDIKRDHAFLIPNGSRLPFRARGEVFYFE